MTPAKKFVEALTNNSNAMYESRLFLWIKLFAKEWNVSEQTVHKYMPAKIRTYPTWDELRELLDQWKSDIEIRQIYKLTPKQFKAIVTKKKHSILTEEQKELIRKSKDLPENLAKEYNVSRTTIDHLIWFRIKNPSEERVLNTGKWDRSEPDPYWKNIWEVHTPMWPAKFIKFNTPLWIHEEKLLSK